MVACSFSPFLLERSTFIGTKFVMMLTIIIRRKCEIFDARSLLVNFCWLTIWCFYKFYYSATLQFVQGVGVSHLLSLFAIEFYESNLWKCRSTVCVWGLGLRTMGFEKNVWWVKPFISKWINKSCSLTLQTRKIML